MMAKSMKAAICTKVRYQFKKSQFQSPKGENCWSVSSSHPCVTRISAWSKGAWGGNSLFPQIIGHEALGLVSSLGPEAQAWGIEEGDLIGAPLWHNMCLECSDCRKAGPQFCTKMQIKGLTCPGYFSEYTCVDAASAIVVRRKEELEKGQGLSMPIRNIAPLFCAGITVWDALEQAQLKMADTVAIVGAGGLGQIATQYSNALGAKVIALDVRDEQLLACKNKTGAHEILNTKSIAPEALPKEIMNLNDGELVDVAIVTSGVIPAYTTALSIVRAYGKVVAVGLPHESIPINAAHITARSISLIGCHVPGQAAAQKCFEFTTRKEIIPLVNERKFKLEDLNEMLELMKAGKIEEGRMVIDFF